MLLLHLLSTTRQQHRTAGLVEPSLPETAYYTLCVVGLPVSVCAAAAAPFLPKESGRRRSHYCIYFYPLFTPAERLFYCVELFSSPNTSSQRSSAGCHVPDMRSTKRKKSPCLCHFAPPPPHRPSPMTRVHKDEVSRRVFSFFKSCDLFSHFKERSLIPPNGRASNHGSFRVAIFGYDLSTHSMPTKIET